MRILLIEDDPLLGDGVRAGFALCHWHCDWVQTVKAAKAAVDSDQFDGIVLDLGLPDGDGVELLQHWRKQGDTTPVLILTARDTVPDRIGGLDAGADDYLVKPFDLDELTARMRALVRRAAGRATPVIEVGDVTLDPAARQVSKRGDPVSLTAREFEILEILFEARGRQVSREHLETSLHGWDDSGEGNSLEVHIHHLRRKLGKELIRTVRGVGYIIESKGP